MLRLLFSILYGFYLFEEMLFRSMIDFNINLFTIATILIM